jgi:hypothetical protein
MVFARRRPCPGMLPAINRSVATKGTGDAAGHVPDIHRPEIIRGVLERVLATSNVFGRGGGRFASAAFRPRRDARHSRDRRDGPSSGQQRSPHRAPRETGTDAMMAYTFVPSPIYSAGEVASAWAVAALLLAVLALA